MGLMNIDDHDHSPINGYLWVSGFKFQSSFINFRYFRLFMEQSIRNGTAPFGPVIAHTPTSVDYSAPTRNTFLGSHTYAWLNLLQQRTHFVYAGLSLIFLRGSGISMYQFFQPFCCHYFCEFHLNLRRVVRNRFTSSPHHGVRWGQLGGCAD